MKRTLTRITVALTLVVALAYARCRGESDYHRMHVRRNGSLA